MIAQSASLSFKMPSGACDTHVHVFGDALRYPMSEHRRYTPTTCSAEDVVSQCRALGLSRAVVIQPTVYGEDNRCTIDAMRVPGLEWRAVVVLSNQIQPEARHVSAAAGAVGIRVNLHTFGQSDPQSAREKLAESCRLAEQLDMHVQLFTSIHVIKSIAASIAEAKVPVVLDHFGGFEPGLGLNQDGMRELRTLLESGNVYVKLSAPYRVSRVKDYSDVAPIAAAFMRDNPERLLWGSDWPHPEAHTATTPDAIVKLRNEDNGRALNRLFEWADDSEKLIADILVRNPSRLYRFDVALTEFGHRNDTNAGG